VALTAGLGVTGTAGAGLRHGRGCAAHRSHTLAQSSRARVYEVRGQTAGGVVGWRVYGCLRIQGRRLRLGERYDDRYVLSSTVSHFRLAGKFVAVLRSSTDISCKADCPPGYQPTRTWVAATDLASGQVRSADTPGLFGDVLVLATTGTAAWLEGAAGAATLQVLDQRGERTLDKGDIPPSSVRLAGTQLSWTRDGQAHAEALN
jgi:hypothetical protein